MRNQLLPPAVACLAGCLVATGCASARSGRPPVPPGVPEAYLHFTDAAVGVGDVAPDFTLPAPGGGTVTLSSLRGKPVVLVFGSFT